MSWRGSLPAACWNANEASNVIPVEAESTSEGVFLATHSTIPITQRDQVNNAKRVTVVDERALLQAVQDQPDDQPIIPILGKSGTGKSHLVRWLRANLKTKESTRVIFVPKHRVSLRGILELILEHATGENADDLRAKVAAAVDAAADEKTARLKLRNALAVNIETSGARSNGSAEEIENRAYLASPQGLPALFGDDVFRARLLHENGPIARLVREKLTGKGTEDKEDAFGFTVEDLNLSVDDVKRAGLAAQQVAGALTSDLGFRELAARMINEQLAPSVSEVFGVGGDDLKQILTDVRAQLNKQGLELLVLIEDFSIFQGIQGGLIDAITLISTVAQELCPMRVVMAVTTGYFINQMPETVFTRTYRVFDLDLPDGTAVAFSPAGFAARYLNAVRVGAAALDVANENNDHPTNACHECPVDEKCHAAFGVADGFGLFPFNQAALERAIKGQSSNGSFVARDVLTRVLRPVLRRDKVEIDLNRFPSEGFATEFKSGADDRLSNIEDQVRLRTPGDVELTDRRVRLVRFWGSGGGAENLDPTIHEAFGIPPIDGLDDVAPEEELQGPIGRPSTSKTTPPDETPTIGPAIPDPPLVKAIDRWRATDELGMTERNTLRNMVHNAVQSRLMLEDGLGGESLWRGGKEFAPSFEGTSVEFNPAKHAAAVLPIDRTNDDDVRALRALAWVNRLGSWADVPDGERLQRLAEARIQVWVEQVARVLLPPARADDDPELVRLTHTLLAVARSLGIGDAYKRDTSSRIQALFAPPPPRPTPDLRPQLAAMQSYVSSGATNRLNRTQLQQRLLRRASYSQGDGKPLALDLAKVSRVIRDPDADMPWPASTPGLVVSSVDAITVRMETLAALCSEAETLLPDLSNLGGDIAQVAAELITLVNERANVAALPDGINVDDLRAAARAIKSGDQRLVETTRAEFDRWSELTVDERMKLITGDWDESARRVRAWLVLAEPAVDLLANSLKTATASDAQREYAEVREKLIGDVATLADALAAIPAAEETA
ncbi:protein DpdH [Kribbella jiaozuonensis]|uniref:Uncharacterized protein n=1 Tax=Kribbella jiaozuonensis TaxID=2575441 RepID=A0A4U3M0L8_9ACTN|nr:protein DpdH [Kribbella jiaozuonensis]TKK81662.1 hypothetical protein FDA38_02155 [Kribbella jiaozuonensis]